jgi:hypothetical protein
MDRKTMEQERLARLGKRKRDGSSSPEQTEVEKPSSPVEEFIKRLPPFTTSAHAFPWIWAENPYRNPRNKTATPRVDYFTDHGLQLLEQSLKKRADIEAEIARKPRCMVTRMLNQESKALQQRIANLASETHVLSGKVKRITRKCACPN